MSVKEELYNRIKKNERLLEVIREFEKNADKLPVKTVLQIVIVIIEVALPVLINIKAVHIVLSLTVKIIKPFLKNADKENK